MKPGQNHAGRFPREGGFARSGFSLIEVVAVIGVSAALLMVVSVLLAGVLQASANNTGAAAWQQTFGRLSRDWRNDVHAANDVVTDEDSARIGAFEYRADRQEILCIEHFQQEAGQRESYRLPAGSKVAFLVEKQARFATIRITSNKRTISIVAAIGLDLRHTQEASP